MFGVLPFLLFYVVPYSLGAVPGPYMKMAVLSLALVPLTWAYAVLRYRLMDVDVIFQQGYVYTLATLCILGLFYGLIFSLGKFEDLSPAAAFAADPDRGLRCSSRSAAGSRCSSTSTTSTRTATTTGAR